MADAELNTETGTALRAPRWLEAACRLIATAGGLVLVGMMLMTVISVTRRTLFGAPLPGDFEMVEMASAVAIFAFLPLCQLRAGNVLVDFFTMRASPRTNHLLEAVGDLIWLVIAALLTWRLSVGAAEFYSYGESSMILRLPLWWGFVVILPSLALLCVTCLWTMTGHLREAFR
ncbi:TRAP transporter small permease subunit [Paracoccus sp. S-4012]|uniref:TRAP transporter small permease n=1 Tax=Paracoccus sp. S-4012 TaxID=2665648 RepID=UPI0012B0E888|nr:TRAP transporter small permease [Paracoccus sp. S-4012]MRX48998.1 TRAP transporter small permease subunit [Paracoccus sp. S-4012]